MTTVNKFVDPTGASFIAPITLNCSTCDREIVSGLSYAPRIIACSDCGLVWKVQSLASAAIEYSLDVDHSMRYQEEILKTVKQRTQEAEQARNKTNKALMKDYGLQIGDPCIYLTGNNETLRVGVVSEETHMNDGSAMLLVESNFPGCDHAYKAWPLDKLQEVIESERPSRDEVYGDWK